MFSSLSSNLGAKYTLVHMWWSVCHSIYLTMGIVFGGLLELECLIIQKVSFWSTERNLDGLLDERWKLLGKYLDFSPG